MKRIVEKSIIVSSNNQPTDPYMEELRQKMQEEGGLRECLKVFCKNQEDITPAKLVQILEANENPNKTLDFLLSILCLDQPHLVKQAIDSGVSDTVLRTYLSLAGNDLDTINMLIHSGNSKEAVTFALLFQVANMMRKILGGTTSNPFVAMCMGRTIGILSGEDPISAVADEKSIELATSQLKGGLHNLGWENMLESLANVPSESSEVPNKEETILVPEKDKGKARANPLLDSAPIGTGFLLGQGLGQDYGHAELNSAFLKEDNGNPSTSSQVVLKRPKE